MAFIFKNVNVNIENRFLILNLCYHLKQISMPTKKAAVVTVTNKQNLLKVITGELQKALVELKEKIGEKKFEKRIKKAAKLLIVGIKETPVKKSTPATKKVISSTQKNIAAPKKVAPSKKILAKVANKK